MAAKQFTENDISFIEYMGGTGFEERDQEFNTLLSHHRELTNDNLVSPRIFQQLFDEHLDPVIESRTYLVGELSDIWAQFVALSQGTRAETERATLKRLSDVGTAAKDRYEGLLKRILTVAVSCASRVYWTKHSSKSYLESLADWLQLKQVHLTSLVNSNADLDLAVKNELEAVSATVVQGLDTVSGLLQGANPTTTTTRQQAGRRGKINLQDTPSVGDKRPLSAVDDDGGNNNNNTNNNAGRGNGGEPLPKRSKQQVPVGKWWGPNNSRLNCSDDFFDIIRASKAYLANPTDAPGTRGHRYTMTQFLRQALDSVGLRRHLNDLLLRNEWNFRDPNLGHSRAPAFIQPGQPESICRLGSQGFRGSNDFKRMLGGGLTASELSPRNHPVTSFYGMLALAHSMKETKLSLRGGGPDDDDDDDVREEREATRKRVRVPVFYDPTTLWEQLLKDATFPKDQFQLRVRYAQPAMTDPDRVGTRTMERLRKLMSRIPLTANWDTIQQEQDVDKLESAAARYKRSLDHARRRAHDFIHNSPGLIFPDQPKLEEAGGRDKPSTRYKGLRNANFLVPLGYVFQARMYQTLRVAIYWKLYLSGVYPLANLLLEEKLLLETWDEQEEMYMEWENNRWFSLSNAQEIADLETRYKSRELLRKIWDNDREGVDESLELLAKDAHHYERQPAIHQTRPFRPTPREHHAAPSTVNVPTQAPSAPVNTTVSPKAARRGTTYGGLYDSDSGIEDEYGKKRTNTGVSSGLQAPPPPNPAQLAIDFLEKARGVYDEKLNDMIRQNDALDIGDPGNKAVISRNNIDIMAKQQGELRQRGQGQMGAAGRGALLAERETDSPEKTTGAR
ncbi:hypothetical protein ONZ43_g4871 [Nemania bipapillata]|uniref:Uncharacterized protein n=1 Tax=Nemania bipapillata TaxID=110536 RepID=A0ACC2IHC5_9PEZI|nr:hypothetical protein ONZ43_g4871 [Nemania bipapillata]